MMDIWPILKDDLERYRSSALSVRQCLFNYESQCLRLIASIKERSFDDSQELFDNLYEIQSKLATAKYKYEFPLIKRLDDFVYHFDRDDIHAREFWYKRFREGQQWPED